MLHILQTGGTEEMKKGRLFIESIMKPYEEVPNSGNMRVPRDVVSIEGFWKNDVIVRSTSLKNFGRK